MSHVIDLADDDDDEILPQRPKDMEPDVKPDLQLIENESLKKPKLNGKVCKNEDSSSFDCIDPQTDEVVSHLRKEINDASALAMEYEALLQESTRRLSGLEQELKNRLRFLREQEDASFNWLDKFDWDKQVHHELKNKFKLSQFRPLQHEAINATLLKRDVFTILPTGGGKSLIYQLSALVDGGVTLVVTPLISLSQDQQKELRNLGINAEAIDSTTNKNKSKQIYKNVLPPGGKIKGSRNPRDARYNKSDKWIKDDMDPIILFVTPEQVVRSKRLMNRLECLHERGHLSRICIDEAHCCSSWGHDFRLDYQKLGILRRQLPNTPIIALSATCSLNTMADVSKILEIRDCVTFRASIDRSNLYYDVRTKPETENELINTIDFWLNHEFHKMNGIIYVLSKKDSAIYAAKFEELGISAACYHGDLNAHERNQVHVKWSSGKLRIVIATIAFGMGINNHLTRFVIHATMATSIEGYYQESGRCGRDGRFGKCIILYKPKDFSRLSSFVADKGAERVEKFYEMYKYVTGRYQNTSDTNNRQKVCRRRMIAQSFGEVPPRREDTESIRRCCDLCFMNSSSSSGSQPKLISVDVSKLASSVCRMIIAVIENKPNEKLTILAVAQNWSVKGVKANQMRNGEDLISRKVSIDARLEVLIELVFQQGLKEIFRHSSYAVNAYVTIGENAEFYAFDSSAKLSVTVGLRAAWELKTFAGCEILDGVDVSEGEHIVPGEYDGKEDTPDMDGNIQDPTKQIVMDSNNNKRGKVEAKNEPINLVDTPNVNGEGNKANGSEPTVTDSKVKCEAKNDVSTSPETVNDACSITTLPQSEDTALGRRKRRRIQIDEDEDEEAEEGHNSKDHANGDDDSIANTNKG